MFKFEKKKLINYCILSLILISSMLLFFYFFTLIQEYQARTYKATVAIYFYPLMYMFMGSLLGIEYWYNQRKREGKWKLRIERLIILGVPSSFFTFYTILIFEVFKQPILFETLHSLLSSSRPYVVGGIFLGYILITSFKKE
jgi:hypothetical protein